ATFTALFSTERVILPSLFPPPVRPFLRASLDGESNSSDSKAIWRPSSSDARETFSKTRTAWEPAIGGPKSADERPQPAVDTRSYVKKTASAAAASLPRLAGTVCRPLRACEWCRLETAPCRWHCP